MPSIPLPRTSERARFALPDRLQRFAATAAFAGACATGAFAADRPNVLWIGVDDLRCAIGAMGDPIAKTPNLDRLAREGVLFTRAYVQQAVCAASRASLLTGCRPDTTTVDYPYNGFFIKTFLPQHPTVPAWFHRAGYYTVGFGKLHHGPPYDLAKLSEPYGGLNAPKGDPWWQTYADPANRALAERSRQDKTVRTPPWEAADVPDDAYADGRMTNAVIAALDRAEASGKPFFLAAGFLRPHLPFNAPRKYWDLYDPATFRDVPPPPGSDVPPYARASLELPTYLGGLSAGGKPVPPEEAQRLRHGYYACVSYLDAQIGRLLDEIERRGLRDSTVIMLWSDHGFHLGENGSWGKHTNYEVAARAPLIIRGPGIDPGVSSRLVEYIDLYPTTCALAGVPPPDWLEGRSLVPLLKTPQAPWTEAAFSQYPRNAQLEGYSIRTPRHRYVEWRDPRGQRVLARELYDHDSDPGETQNLATAEPKLAEDLSQRLATQFRFGKAEPSPEPAATP